ncbi:hypothetical protein Tco_0796984 [Tanacetum coccineum]
MESELWSLTIKGTDVVGYTQRFQELALLCPRMVLDEEVDSRSATHQRIPVANLRLQLLAMRYGRRTLLEVKCSRSLGEQSLSELPSRCSV